MVYVVVCGVLLGICLLKLKDELNGSYPSKLSRSILQEIYSDLIHLFYYKKPGKFIGPLEPLNDLKVLQNLVMVEDNESYTINKKIIHLCTKDPQNGRVYDKNTLMFVVLHELAHVLCPEIGHTETFLSINYALLDHAVRNGVYDPSKPFIKNYCSL